jgi:hypothetical protein
MSLLPLALLVACRAFPDLEASPGARIATTLSVSWEGAPGEEAWVEYGLGALTHRAPTRFANGRYFATLVGFPPLAEVTFRPGRRVGDAEELGDTRTAEVGLPPAGLPTFTPLAGDWSGEPDELILTTTIGQEGGNVLLVNPDGEIVWYITFASRYAPVHAEASRDGDGLVYNYLVREDEEEAGLCQVELSGAKRFCVPVPQSHHGFAQLPGGRYAMLVSDTRLVGEKLVEGDALIEVATNGDSFVLYSPWDHLKWDSELQPDTDGYVEWTHANGVFYDEAEDTALVSMRNVSTIAQVDVSDAELLAVYGGVDGWGFSSPGDSFLYAHGPAFTADRQLLVFDNQDVRKNDPSRVMRYTLNAELERLEPTYTFYPDDGRSVSVLGSVFELGNGDLITSWGSSGEILRLTPEAELSWGLGSDVGFILGAAFVVPAFAPRIDPAN